MLLDKRGTDKIRRASHLQDWRLKVFLDDEVLSLKLPGLGTVDAKLALEAADDDLVLRRIAVVNITHADGAVVVLFTGAHRRGPPFLQLED